MAAAWIGFASGVLAAIIAVVLAVRQARTDVQVAQLKSDLDAELHRRQGLIDRELAAADVLERYREPLAVAAFDLQSRLYNILKLRFFDKFGGKEARGEVALRTTLFRVAQYFGWTEILRRDIQFLSFPEAADTRRVANLQSEIARAFLTDAHGSALMIWSDEQRALGELMITEEHGKVIPMGYAAFERECDSSFRPWLARLGPDFEDERSRDRLVRVQHLLCELVETLDTRRVRYQHDLERA